MHWSKLCTTTAAHPWLMKKWTVCFQVWVKERVRLTLYLNYCNKYLGFYAKQMSDSENNNLSICTNKLNDDSLCTSPLHTGTNTLSSLVMSVSYIIPHTLVFSRIDGTYAFSTTAHSPQHHEPKQKIFGLGSSPQSVWGCISGPIIQQKKEEETRNRRWWMMNNDDDSSWWLLTAHNTEHTSCYR